MNSAAPNAATHVSLSHRVNDLFARYVETEEEQRRLGEAGHDKEADALCEPARILSRQIHDIRDRTGNADLIVSRLLLELMLTNQWEKVVPGYEWLDWDQHNMLLPIIGALADRTTGVVRVHATKALATIGVEVTPQLPDPMLSLVQSYQTEYATALDRYDADFAAGQGDENASAWRPLCDRLCFNPPMPTSLVGAAEGIRLVRDESNGAYNPDLIRNVLTVVADALEGRA